MIWLVPKATGMEISPIPKGSVDLLQLPSAIPLVLVVGPSWMLHTVEKQLIHDPWEIIPPHRLF